MRALVAALLLLLYVTPAFAQCPTLSGEVVNGPIKTYISTGTSATLASRSAALIAQGWAVLSTAGSASNPSILVSCPVVAPPPPPPPPPSPPGALTSPSPATGAANVATNVTLSWASVGATSYDLAFGTAGALSLVATNLTVASFAPNLAAGTAYVWQVTARNAGGSTVGPLWTFTTAAVAPAPDPTPVPTGALFFSGWERTTETGCTLNGLLDGGAWGDFGPAYPGVCPLAQVVVKDGSRALQVTQVPGNQNGTDFRIEKSIGSQGEITVAWRQQFAPDFRFATGDHKMLIVGGGGGQNVYANIRGNAADPTQGRITVHVIPVDTAMSDASVPIRVGQWYDFKLNVKAGANGYVKFKVNGQLLTLVTEAGNQANPLALNTGAIDFIKPDTTYNIGSFITAPWNVWYDNVTVTAGSAAF